MFIHERDHWTNFTWDKERIAQQESKVNHRIGYLLGRLSTIGFNEQLLATVESITSDVVASSEIEGVSLNSAEVRSSVARKLGVDIKSSKDATHNVDGIVEMMLDATQNYQNDMSDARLFNWHAALFPHGKSGVSNIAEGQYRTEEMEVLSGMFGREKLHYRAPKANVVNEEMHQFLTWFNNKWTSSHLIKSAIAHFWFVSIHPFDDGNGRIARAISDLLLARAEGSKLRFYSISTQICSEKKEYYRVLERTQRGEGDITEWLSWFLSCLYNAVIQAETMLSAILNKAMFWKTFANIVISSRQRDVLNIYLDGCEAKLTAKNWAKQGKVSTDTANRDIKNLVNKGVLTADKGRVRDVAYSINYIVEDDFIPHFTNVKVYKTENNCYISAQYNTIKEVTEQISAIDHYRLEQGEVTKEKLLYKYFAYLGS